MSTQLDLSQLVKTCSACPTQWEGPVPGVGKIYFRYRWGGASVWRHPDENAELFAHGGEDIYHGSHGDGLDGFMEDEQVFAILHEVLEPYT